MAYWLAEVIKPNREDSTYSHYELMTRLHVMPGIGKKRLDKLTDRETQAWLNKLPGICQCCAQGKDAKRRQPKCCTLGQCCEDFPGRRVIQAARGTLRAGLNHAMREELISRNVAELVTLPKTRKKNRRRNSWTVEEACTFLESSRNDNDPLYPLWVLLIVLGMRKGRRSACSDPTTTGCPMTKTTQQSSWNGSYNASAATRSPTSDSSRQMAALTQCHCPRSG
jgi:hypothetical protein